MLWSSAERSVAPKSFRVHQRFCPLKILTSPRQPTNESKPSTRLGWACVARNLADKLVAEVSKDHTKLSNSDMRAGESLKPLEAGPNLQIVTDYHSYVPPLRLTTTVRRLLSSVPSESLVGLQSVVISDRNRYTTKVKVEEALSFYHEQTRERRPWIELLVDNIFSGYPRWLLWLPFLREVLISQPLFTKLHITAMHISAECVQAHRSVVPTRGR